MTVNSKNAISHLYASVILSVTFTALITYADYRCDHRGDIWLHNRRQQESTDTKAHQIDRNSAMLRLESDLRSYSSSNPIGNVVPTIHTMSVDGTDGISQGDRELCRLDLSASVHTAEGSRPTYR